MTEAHCVNCNCSIGQEITSHLLRTDTDKENLITNTITQWIQPTEISSSSLICHPCWQKANRTSVNIIEHSASISAATTSNGKSEIYLQNYTRAASTTRRCIFPNCKESERMRIPTSIRSQLICDFSFYVPANCRICNRHLQNRSWNDLFDVENGIHTFTAAFIEDFILLLKKQASNNINFENIEESDDNLVHYWLGMAKNEFKEILQEVTRLNNIHRGAIGLAAYLTKLNTGDTDQHLATLFKIPRTTLERLMNNVNEILTQDHDPENVGLHKLLSKTY